jgi:peptidoglycan/LPS O-acetylase OafA/YrhL
MDRVRTTTSHGRLDALDSIRGLFAFGIVLVHVWMFDYGADGHPPKGPLDMAIGELRLGVPMFFLMSGFLLYRPFAAAALDGRPAPSIRGYALRRAARILPAYWLALAASFTLLTAIDHPKLVAASELPLFLLFLQNYLPQTANQLDPPTWTLAVEASFYVVLPLIALAAIRLGGGRRRQAAYVGAIIALGLALASLSVLQDWPATARNSLLGHLPEFGIGMLLAVLVHGRTVSRRTGAALIAAGVALVVADAAWHANTLGPLTVRRLVGDLPAVLGFALIFAAYALAPLRGRIMCSVPLRITGTLSYPLYLLHFPAIYLLRHLDLWPQRLFAAYAVVLAVTLPAAALSWLVVERPALRWARRFTAGRRHRQRRAGGLGRPATASARS